MTRGPLNRPTRGLVPRIVAIVLILAAGASRADAQHAALPAPPVAFVNVTVITMDPEAPVPQPGQTVLVRDGRIAAVGPASDVIVPAGATVIDGRGRYLVPGLTDAHVHLVGDGTARGATRANFGDAPLYLAHGVTTVINLRGTPEQLEWRRRIEAGALPGPTIYTAGEFVNEPRVRTPQDVEREILEQKAQGYDLIKFHEVYTADAGEITTSGLSREAYLHMHEVARREGLPIVGHAPVNLGLEGLLEAGQPLAHLGALANVYFLPMTGNVPWLLATVVSVGGLVLIAVAGATLATFRRPKTPRQAPQFLARIRVLVGLEILAMVGAVVSAVMFLPGGPHFDSLSLRLGFTVAVLVLTGLAAALLLVTARIWRDDITTPGRRMQVAAAALLSLTLVCTVLIFWLPIAWRSSDAGIERLAARLAAAGIPVQTTLIAYDAIGGPGRPRLVNDPALEYLTADVRSRWQRVPQVVPREYRYTAFMQKVAGALHRAGAPLLAGTDAMGYPWITPGSSLHRELALLAESGLTASEVLHTATVAPARFLGRLDEFGMVAAGRRADLLLVAGNPLDDLNHLRHPDGVMASGRWFSREELSAMLAALAQEP
jgi:imidazolonepropionase-like amidohydrolase